MAAKAAPVRDSVFISPPWLKAMIPPDWMHAAEQLLAIQKKYGVSNEDMERFVSIGATAPVPLVAAVEKFAAGDWIIEMREGHVHVSEKNPVIVPTAGQVSKFGKAS